MKSGQAAYRVIDRSTIAPIASDEEASTLERAFADLSVSEFHGARSHLRAAASSLTAGVYADSIRESIHAIESVARVLAASGDLNQALVRLEIGTQIHPALKRGFMSIYGYTSDEKGVRHALLNAPEARVDEHDALFMMGACASFVSYLIGKARATGLLKVKDC